MVLSPTEPSPLQLGNFQCHSVSVAVTAEPPAPPPPPPKESMADFGELQEQFEKAEEVTDARPDEAEAIYQGILTAGNIMFYPSTTLVPIH